MSPRTGGSTTQTEKEQELHNARQSAEKGLSDFNEVILAMQLAIVAPGNANTQQIEAYKELKALMDVLYKQFESDLQSKKMSSKDLEQYAAVLSECTERFDMIRNAKTEYVPVQGMMDKLMDSARQESNANSPAWHAVQLAVTTYDPSRKESLKERAEKKFEKLGESIEDKIDSFNKKLSAMRESAKVSTHWYELVGKKNEMKYRASEKLDAVGFSMKKNLTQFRESITHEGARQLLNEGISKKLTIFSRRISNAASFQTVLPSPKGREYEKNTLTWESVLRGVWAELSHFAENHASNAKEMGQLNELLEAFLELVDARYTTPQDEKAVLLQLAECMKDFKVQANCTVDNFSVAVTRIQELKANSEDKFLRKEEPTQEESGQTLSP